MTQAIADAKSRLDAIPGPGTDRDQDAPQSTQQDITADNGGPTSGLRIERAPQRKAPDLDTRREVPLWERDDAPDGSTESSLLHYEDGVAKRVSGPTHYTHLANGQIIGSYGIGTHHDDGDGPVPVVAHYAG